jgi:hypothetical protein
MSSALEAEIPSVNRLPLRENDLPVKTLASVKSQAPIGKEG